MKACRADNAEMQAGVGLIEMPNSADLEFSDECLTW